MNRKPFLMLIVLLLFVLMVSTVGAQDSFVNPDIVDPDIVDQEVGDFVILEQNVTPDGIQNIVQIPNKKDAFISSNKPDNNFGLRSDMRLGYSLSGESLGAVRMLLQYQVQDYIPTGAVINNATLHIYLSGVTPSGDSSMGFKALYLASDWSEKTVTWNLHNPSWGSEIGVGNASSQLGWHTADMTKMVREWIDGGRKNYGFTLVGDEGVKDRQRVYFTKDANNGLSSYLKVDYVVSTDTTPPVATVKKLPEWSPSSFPVEWEGYDPNNPDGSPGSGIKYYDVWDSTDNGSSWHTWRAQVTETKSTFDGGQHLQTYSFTARAKDHAGNEQPRDGVQAWTKVDAVAPVVSMNALPPISVSPFTISWGGTDSGSGIASYDVEWREQGQAWQTLYQNTTLTSFTAHDPENGVTYEFRARGSDKVGNHQAWTDVQAWTTVSTNPVSTITGTAPQPILQIKSGPGPTDSFQVFWQGQTAAGTGPLTYTVYVQKPNAAWTVWLSNTPLTSDTYLLDVNDPDGTYYFEVTARNNQGQQENFNQVPEGLIIVDRLAPFFEQAAWMPIIITP